MYNSIEELQTDVDVWLDYYNTQRPHTGKYCYGKTPMQTWNESLHLAKEKLLNNQSQNVVSLPVSDETETGSGGDQPARDNLTDWNGQKGQISPSSPLIIPGLNALENALPQ